MEQSILSAGSAELARARDMLAEQQGLRASVEELREEKTKADKSLQAAERSMTDSINSTVKKRRADLESGFNKEIQKEQSALKKERNAREKAKSRSVAERITEETSELREKNRLLHVEIKSRFRQKGVPRFCDSKVYYALYMPGRVTDLLVCAAFLIVFFAVLPGVVAYFAGKLWQRIVIFGVFWVVSGGIYVIIYRITKGRNRDVLVEMKASRKEILKNEKEIRRIKKAIHRDKNEDLYDLEKYDRKIREHEEMIGQLTDRKNIVMLDFETNTRKAITDEITERNAEKLEALRGKSAELGGQISEMVRREKSLSSDLASDYQAYLGLEFMDTARLQALMELIDSGQAATVQDAMSLWKQREWEKKEAATRGTVSGKDENTASVDFAEEGSVSGQIAESMEEVPDGAVPNLEEDAEPEVAVSKLEDAKSDGAAPKLEEDSTHDDISGQESAAKYGEFPDLEVNTSQDHSSQPGNVSVQTDRSKTTRSAKRIKLPKREEMLE